MGTVEKRDKHKKRRFVSPEEKLERELKDCMHCRFFWGHNNRCANGTCCKPSKKKEQKLPTECVDCQHFFRQIFLGYFSDIVQAFDTLRKNVCGDDYTSLHNPIVLYSVLPAYGMFHSIQILFL